MSKLNARSSNTWILVQAEGIRQIENEKVLDQGLVNIQMITTIELLFNSISFVKKSE